MPKAKALECCMILKAPPATERLTFRRYTRDDLPLVENMFADPEIGRFNPSMRELGGVEQWINRNLHSYPQGTGLWALERKQDGKFIGECGLTYQPVEGKPLLEVGYNLLREHRGKGYATEAAKTCIAFAFDQLAAAVVCSIVDPENAPSITVATRIHHHQRWFTDHRGWSMLLFWSENS